MLSTTAELQPIKPVASCLWSSRMTVFFSWFLRTKLWQASWAQKQTLRTCQHHWRGLLLQRGPANKCQGHGEDSHAAVAELDRKLSEAPGVEHQVSEVVLLCVVEDVQTACIHLFTLRLVL